MLHRERGLTLTETAVWLGAAVLLTAVLVPTLRSHYAMSDILRARNEVRVIGQALERFHRDMQIMPGEKTAEVLTSSGKMPLESGEPELVTWNRGKSERLHDHLVSNAPHYKLAAIAVNGWAGPYMDSVPEGDPWGNRYLVNSVNYRTTNAMVVLSAGPDGEIQTPFNQHVDNTVTHGDDIVYRIW